ncbi:MAG: glutathione S-transferase family protein [Myxococcales bacterium]|nr:glutathione S-transferase family protein [Myxococcales bacterium]
MASLPSPALLVALIVGGGFVIWWAWQNQRRRTHPVPPGLQEGIDLPFDEEFELYHNALSLCSMKTRLCMAELGVRYKSHHIDLIETGCYENIRPRLLDVNPGGTVPVLVHQGHPVYESHEQIRFAAQHALPSSPGLIPDDAAARAEMESWIDRTSLTDDPIQHGDQSAGNAVPGLTLPLFCTMIEKIPFWKIFEGVLFHFDKKRPLLFVALKTAGIEKIGRLGLPMKILARSRDQMGVHLDALEAQLEKTGGPWLLGTQYTLADVGWLVIFERLRQVDSIEPFLGNGQRPACAGYWTALTSRPAYREAILEHSQPLIEQGLERLRSAKDADPVLRQLLEGG